MNAIRTMRCALRRLHSPDAYDLATYSPPDPAHFGVLVQAMIGPLGGPGEESFDFVLCTPSWLASEVRERGLVWGQAHVIVDTYDYVLLRSAVEDACRTATGQDWDAIATMLGRKFRWEFEDYRPSAR